MIITEDDDGRQVITYTIPPDGLDDEVTLRLQVTWMYLLGQFWAYPAVVIILLILLIRRRRRKKKRKSGLQEKLRIHCTKLKRWGCQNPISLKWPDWSIVKSEDMTRELTHSKRCIKNRLKLNGAEFREYARRVKDRFQERFSNHQYLHC